MNNHSCHLDSLKEGAALFFKAVFIFLQNLRLGLAPSLRSVKLHESSHVGALACEVSIVQNRSLFLTFLHPHLN